MDRLISIIVPTYNRAHSLPMTIESILRQTADNWELIIIDDGSTDHTKEAIKIYLSDHRIEYFYQKNAGVAAARNKGVEISRGNYLIFLDSDDMLLPGLIAKLDQIPFTNYDLICWEVVKIIDGKKSVWKPQKLEKIYNNITVSFLAGSICYKKEVFIDAGKFDAEMSFGENYELGIRISKREDLKIHVLNEQYLVYSINSKNRTSNSLNNRLHSYCHQYQKHKAKYEKDKSSHSRINYLLGFVHEKLKKKSEAIKFYRSSFLIDPLNWKALLRLIYLKLIRS